MYTIYRLDLTIKLGSSTKISYWLFFKQKLLWITHICVLKDKSKNIQQIPFVIAELIKLGTAVGARIAQT